jgi:hypothetical protein
MEPTSNKAHSQTHPLNVCECVWPTEKSAVTPSARSVQMKKKPPLRVVPKPTPAPLTWMTGTPINRSGKRRMWSLRPVCFDEDIVTVGCGNVVKAALRVC